MNAKGIQRTSQRRVQRRANNVRVLRPKKRARLNIGRILLFGVSIAFMAWAIYPITYRMQQNHELSNLKKQLAGIERENDNLREKVKRLGSDDYVEQRARSLGLSKPDEELIVVMPENPSEQSKAKASKAKEEPENRPVSLWQRIANTFSNVF